MPVRLKKLKPCYRGILKIRILLDRGSTRLIERLRHKSKLLEVIMELTVIYQCVAALDIHQAKLTVCMMFMNALGQVVSEIREFGGFKRDRRAMAEWVASFNPELVVMESTGIYWKSPYAALER